MEGLEAAEIRYKELFIDNDIFRIDAEFYNKEGAGISEYIKTLTHIYIDSKNIVSGPFGSTLKSDSYLTEGVPFVRIENIKGGFYIDDSEIIYISESDNERLKNSQLNIDDLILSKVGNSIGYFARVDEEIGRCNISENNIGIKLHNFDIPEKHYILTYLNCYFAQKLVLRRRSGNAQPKLNVGDLAYIPIPVFPMIFYNGISKIITVSHELKENCRKLYEQAENILLKELDLKNWNPTEQTVSYKSFSDFETSGRLDAEYYQPKYDELFTRILKFETKLLGNIATIRKSIEPGSDAYQDKGIPFMRVSNLTKFGLSESDIHLERATYETQELKPKKDTILLTKDGSVGIAYKLEDDLDAITSGAILHLNVCDNEFLPDYLTLVLNSIIVKMQAERDAGGSIIQHWKPSEIEQVVIPKLSIDIQKIIATKIQESFVLKAESKRLLDLAKTAVEVAIEKGESEAMKIIKI